MPESSIGKIIGRFTKGGEIDVHIDPIQSDQFGSKQLVHVVHNKTGYELLNIDRGQLLCMEKEELDKLIAKLRSGNLF